MALRQIQQILTKIPSRNFQTSPFRLAANVFHVKNVADFQKEVLESKKAVIVDFHATWSVKNL